MKDKHRFWYCTVLVLGIICWLCGCAQQKPQPEQQITVEEMKESSAIDAVNMNHYYFVSSDGINYIRYKYEYPKPKEDENTYLVASETKVGADTLMTSIEQMTGWHLGFVSCQEEKEGILVAIDQDSDIFKPVPAGKSEYKITDQKILVKSMLGSMKKTVQAELSVDDQQRPVYFVDKEGQPLVIEGVPEFHGEAAYTEEWQSDL